MTSNTTDMKTLPTEFRKDGFTFQQLKRDGDLSLYRKTKDAIGGPITSWEIVRIRTAAKSYTFPNGSIVEAGDESCPGNESWGSHGFTYSDEEKARKRFRQMTGIVNAPSFDAELGPLATAEG